MRDPELVLRDVMNGLVTPEWAAKIYGVVVVANPWRVDRAATQKQRDAVYSWRKRMATNDERRTTKDDSPKSGLGRKTKGVRKTTSVKRQMLNGKRGASGVKRKRPCVNLSGWPPTSLSKPE